VPFPARAHSLIGDLRGKDRRQIDRCPIDVQRQLITRHGVFFHRMGEQFLECSGAFRVLDKLSVTRR